MKTKLGGALLGLALIGITAPVALAELDAPSLTAMVVNQQCQGGDFVNVTLTASLQPNRRGVTYIWDFNNDGVFDTAPSADPMVSQFYPDEVNATARVQAMKGNRSVETTVTFGTLRCGN